MSEKGNRFIDRTGEKFGQLTVVSFDRMFHGSYWNCLCSCGETKSIAASSLTHGITKSCGCSKGERISKKLTKHGEGGKSVEYSTWRGIKARCLNPNATGYERWGGRGITVCSKWRDSFENFLSDMGRKPSKNHTIERVDNDGNYEPSNCVWATRKEQALNRRSNLVVNGKRTTLAECANRIGISVAGLWNRIYTLGWDLQRALTEELHVEKSH